MKLNFDVDGKQFQQALNLALKAAWKSKKNMNRLPAQLAHISVNKHIQVWGLSPDEWQFTEELSGHVTAEGNVSLLRDAVKRIKMVGKTSVLLSEDSVTFEDNGKKLDMQDFETDAYETNQNGGFHRFEDPSGQIIGQIKAKELKQLFERLLPYLSKDILRESLTHIYFDFPQGKVVGTDGTKLALIELPSQFKYDKALLVKPNMSLIKNFTNDNNIVDVIAGDNSLSFKVNYQDKRFREVTLINNDIKYPEYMRVFPDESDKGIEQKEISVAELKQFVKTVKDQDIKNAFFTFDGNGNTIIRDEDKTIELLLKNITILKTKASFNLDIFEDGIAALDNAETVLLTLHESGRGFMLTIKGSDCRCIIMSRQRDED